MHLIIALLALVLAVGGFHTASRQHARQQTSVEPDSLLYGVDMVRDFTEPLVALKSSKQISILPANPLPLAANRRITKEAMDAISRPLTAVSTDGCQAADSCVDEVFVDYDPCTDKFLLKHSRGPLTMAFAVFDDKIKQAGWSHLRVETVEGPVKACDGASILHAADGVVAWNMKMYAAGAAEGYLTASRIKDFYSSAEALEKRQDKAHRSLENVRTMFYSSITLIQQQAGWHKDAKSVFHTDECASDPPVRHASWLLFQVWGVMDGYNVRIPDAAAETRLNLLAVFFINSDGETPELMEAYDPQYLSKRQETSPNAGASAVQLAQTVSRRRHQSKQELIRWLNRLHDHGRCSALIRLVDTQHAPNHDIMVGHSTWENFSEMFRIWKVYHFQLPDAAAKWISFSSYPGAVTSTDDFYLTDANLLITETTITIMNAAAYVNVLDKPHVPDFMRIAIATRLSKTGEEWIRHFRNTVCLRDKCGDPGTYNSQWMIVDYNRFNEVRNKDRPLPEGTFYVYEQVPGSEQQADMSRILKKFGYFASYNRAWFPMDSASLGEVASIGSSQGKTGSDKYLETVFKWNEQSPTRRGQDFAGLAPKVKTLWGNPKDPTSMSAVMQWNDVGKDPRVPPDQQEQIAARFDLYDPDRLDGAVDSKIVNTCLFGKLQCDAISGPEHTWHKAFDWSQASAAVEYPHAHQPLRWDFDWWRMSLDGMHPSPKTEC